MLVSIGASRLAASGHDVVEPFPDAEHHLYAARPGRLTLAGFAARLPGKGIEMETFLAILCDLIPWVVFAVFAVAAAANPVLWLRERRSTRPAPRRAEAARA